MTAITPHITDLVYRSLADELEEVEQAELDQWLDASAKRRQWYQDIADNGLAEAMQRGSGQREAVLEDIHARIRMVTGISSERDGADAELISHARVRRVHFLKTAWFRVAVAVIVLFSIGAYLWLQPSSDSDAITQTKPVPAKNDVLPGYNRAVLTLSDGKTVALDSAAGKIITDGSVAINNTEGQLVYSGAEVAAINTMTTPKGGQYQLTLADGTKVWLNAASSITYPTAFTGKTREVEIKGEAYFEVAKNKAQPFIVHAGDQNINVIGTAFNVNAYNDEKRIKTTLIEGAVKINNIQLKPGQAFDGRKIIISNVQQDVAWKNGRFDFNHIMLEKGMRQLARWYDIEVKYPNGIPDIEFAGGLERSLTLKEVLEILEEPDVKFELNGKQLLVKHN